MHSPIFKMNNQQGPTAWHRELCSMLCGSLVERSSGENRYMYIHIWLEPFYCLPETITTLLIGYAAAAKSLQSCQTLCDPIDGSPLGSLSLGFSRQEHWSGLPFPSPMHESEK